MANDAVLTTPSLRRRNSITTPLVVPSNYSSSTSPSTTTTTSRASSTSSSTTSSSTSTQSFPAADFEQLIKPSSYTSIRDLLPSPAVVQSPTASSAQSGGYEISIRNRLVKQAAWAYLQPISLEPESSARSLIHRLVDLVNAPVLALFRLLTRSFEWMLRSVRVKSAW